MSAIAQPRLSREVQVDNWLHRAGVLLGALGACALLAATAVAGGDGRLVPMAVYAGCLVAMLGASAAYHLARRPEQRRILRRLDHAAIFLMIAGTYTPFTTLVGANGLTVFVWAAALVGVAIKLGFARWLERASPVFYLALGWTIIAQLDALTATLSSATVALILAGGIVYTLGVPFHLWRRLPFHNAIWHGFVLAGAACHYVAVLQVIA